METTVTLRNEEERGLISEIESVWTGFQQAPVTNGEEHQRAANNRVALKKYIKQLDEVRKGHTRPIDDLKKSVLAYFGAKEEVLNAALKQIDRAILTYDAELQRIRAEQQRRMEEEARALAEKERQRLEAQALAALAKGDEAKATRLVEKAEEVTEVVPVLAPIKPKAEGTAFRTVLKYEIVAPHEVERELCDPSPQKVAAKVKIVGPNGKVPGVRIWEEKIVAGTRF